jgi:hypothetical protein
LGFSLGKNEKPGQSHSSFPEIDLAEKTGFSIIGVALKFYLGGNLWQKRRRQSPA